MKKILLPALAVLVLASACKKNDDPAQPTTIKLTTDAKLGNHLTDEQGNTLYYYGLDVNGFNSCSGGCAEVWPLFYEANLQVGPGLSAADFTTVKTAAGENQTFYKGWPLYYYASLVNGRRVRESAGATNGEGLGNDWFVARPDYTIMIGKNSMVNKATNQTSSKIYLIDTQGHTLYTYSKDARQPTSQPTNCQGNCATAYPVFYQAKIVAPSILKASDFGTITRTDGPNGSTRLQTTYRGQPLYYCASDNSVPGRVTSDGAAGADGSSDTWSVALL